MLSIGVVLAMMAACNKGSGGENVTSNSPNGSEHYVINAVNVIEYGGAEELVTVAAVSYPFDPTVSEAPAFIMSRNVRSAAREAGIPGTRTIGTRVGGNTVATSPYVNKSFRLALTPPPESDLSAFPEPPPGSTIAVSDPAARTSFVVEVEGHNAAGEYMDDFWYETADFSIYAQYMYADRDVNVTGGFTATDEYGTYSEQYEVYLKKGWNLTYYDEGFGQGSDVYIYHMYTELPVSVAIRWDFGIPQQ